MKTWFLCLMLALALPPLRAQELKVPDFETPGAVLVTHTTAPIAKAQISYTATTLMLISSAWAQESRTPLTVTVDPGARQTFDGMGASLFRYTTSADYNRQLTRAQQRALPHLLWHDARFRSVRLWIHPDDFLPAPDAQNIAPYVDGWMNTHKLPDTLAAGATRLNLAPDNIPAAMGDGHGLIRDTEIPSYAALLAAFIRVFKDRTGILIGYAAVLNEPNDRPVKLSDAQWPVMIKALRRALDVRGLQSVWIIAPELANCGADAYAVVDAIKADREAWHDLKGIATHSYNNAAREEMAIRAVGKEYWMTEAGGTTDADEDVHDGLQAASIASRFLNDVNHRVTDWQFFIGFEQADPRGNTGRIIKYDPAPYKPTILQKYYYLKQLSETFDVGAAFRHSRSSLDGEMDYTYGKKPRVNTAAARNPDGTWGIGLSNFTSPSFRDADNPKDFALHNSGYPAQAFQVTVRMPELAKVKAMRFAVRQSTATVGDRPGGVVVMHNGVLTVPIVPLELVTLRSISVTRQHSPGAIPATSSSCR